MTSEPLELLKVTQVYESPIRENNKATRWDLSTEGPKTLNGLVLEQLESIPDGNVSFMVEGYRFETEEIKGAMVKKVSVTQMKKPVEPEE